MSTSSLGRVLATAALIGASLIVGCESSSSNESAGGAGGAGGETCTMGTSGSTKQECLDPAVILGQGGGANDGGGGGAAQGGGGAAADGGGGGGDGCPSNTQAHQYLEQTDEFILFVTGPTPGDDGTCCYMVTHQFCH